MKKSLTLFLRLLTYTSISACSCTSMKAVNVFSYFEYIGIVEFQSITEIKNDSNYYSSTHTLKRLFKGSKNSNIYINSLKETSCAFIPKIGREYLILGERRNGRIEISFCSAMRVPSEETLIKLDQLIQLGVDKRTSRNMYQTVREQIDSQLFPKEEKGIFIYKIKLDQELKITALSPFNTIAKSHFNKEVDKFF